MLESRYSRPTLWMRSRVLGVSLEQLAAHEVDEGRRVGRHPEDAAAWLHLNDLDALIDEHAMVLVHDRTERGAAVRGLFLVRRPRAHDANVMSARGEARRELVREALRSADRGVATLREQQPHRTNIERTCGASLPLRKRPRSLRRRGT